MNLLKLRSGILFLSMIFYCFTNSFSQQPQTSKIQLPEISNEKKHSYSVFRTDAYICTGIAYAKSLGMTVKDFAIFVGNNHSMTSSTDTSIAAIVRTFHLFMTTYPTGMFEILNQTESNAEMIWNRPYLAYFKNEPLFGVTLNEFEDYLYGHIAIMTKRIGVDFKYNIKNDTIFGNLTRYR